MIFYALAGNFNEEGNGGLSLFRYAPNTGKMSLMNRVRADVRVGAQFIDERRHLIYITD